MADQWKGQGGDLQSFGRRAVVLIPGSSDLTDIPKAIVAIGAGNITVIPVNNLDADTITFTGVSAGFVVPLICRRVTSGSGGVIAVYD